MPDINDLISQGGNNNSLQSLGSIMNVGAQGQSIQSNALILQKQQQVNNERIATQNYISKPELWQNEDGTANLGKMNKALSVIAPLTGADTLQKYTTLSQGQTEADKAKVELTGTMRSAFGGVLAAMANAGVNNPQVANKAIDDFVRQYPDVPAINRMGDATKKIISVLPADKMPNLLMDGSNHLTGNDATVTPRNLMTQAMTTMSPTAQKELITPNLQNTGKEFVDINPVNKTLGTSKPIPNNVQPTIIIDANGQPHYVGGNAKSGNIAADNWPTQASVSSQRGASEDMINHFRGLESSAQSMPVTTALTKTIEGLSPSAFTGVGGDKKQYIAGLATALGVDPTAAQTDTNLLNKAFAQLNMSSPAGTDAARTLLAAGQPHSTMDQAAIKEAAGTIAGQIKMNAAERNFLNTARYSNKGMGDVGTYQQGKQQFEAVADPRIWQYEELLKNNRDAAAKFLKRQPDAAVLADKTDALTKMGFFRK